MTGMVVEVAVSGKSRLGRRPAVLIDKVAWTSRPPHGRLSPNRLAQGCARDWRLIEFDRVHWQWTDAAFVHTDAEPCPSCHTLTLRLGAALLLVSATVGFGAPGAFYGGSLPSFGALMGRASAPRPADEGALRGVCSLSRHLRLPTLRPFAPPPPPLHCT